MLSKKQALRNGRAAMGIARGLKNTALATAAGAALAAGNLAHAVRDKAADFGSLVQHNTPKPKSREVVTMKKSTLVAVLVALGAVAGVLAALYAYVLRREKELDEYEQLLFSEEFNDDLPYDDEDLPAEEDKK